MSNSKIEYILDHFDWERVSKVMDALDWKWSAGDGEMVRPTFTMMRQAANRLLDHASESDLISIKSGGFAARKLSDGHLELCFEIDDVESWDMESDS